MTRGIVLWPDADATARIQELWGRLDAAGVQPLSLTTHRRHRPHCSLVVADAVDVDAALPAVRSLADEPIPFVAGGVGYFLQGVLFLAVSPSSALLEGHRRVHATAAKALDSPWAYYAPGAWLPHITLAVDVDRDQVPVALAALGPQLRVEGTFAAEGVEDGDTGERWVP